MIAKKRSALRHLHENMRENRIEKRYLTLVMGQWRGGRRKIDAPLRKFVLQGGERMVRVNPEGKPARSWFSPVSVWPQASLMQVKLDTGRTHQIRVHATHSDHPIAGDEKYGDEAFNRNMRVLGLKRLFLHAYSLTLELPNEGGQISVSAPLPPELETVVAQLEQQHG